MTGEVRQAAQRTIHLGCRPFGHMLNEGFKLRMRRFPREVKNQNVKTSKSKRESNLGESSIPSMSAQKFHDVRSFPTDTSALTQDFSKGGNLTT